jgi:hypothetical protein
MGVVELEATPLRVFNITDRLCIIPACLSWEIRGVRNVTGVVQSDVLGVL